MVEGKRAVSALGRRRLEPHPLHAPKNPPPVKATILISALLASLLPAFAADLEKESVDFGTVYNAGTFIIGSRGLDGKLSAQELAFRRLLKAPDAADQCFRLRRAEFWAARFYGFLGLKLLNDPRYAESIHPYFAQKGQMSLSLNSRNTETPISVIARMIDKGEIK